MNEDSEIDRGAPEGMTRRSFVAAGTAVGGALTIAQSNAPSQAQSRQPQSGAFWPDGVRLPITISMMWESRAEPMPQIDQRFVPPETRNKSWPDLSLLQPTSSMELIDNIEDQAFVQTELFDH
jgi:hypothetical protein